MEYRKIGETYYIRMDRGDEIVSTLKNICRQEGILSATYSGIGGCSDVEMQVFIPERGEFETEKVEGPLELVSLMGNVVSDDSNQLFHHTHALFTWPDNGEHKSISIADQIFDQLEKDILSGKYERGEVLSELRLSKELNVSRTPIREALLRLEQENVLRETGRGMEVIGISGEDMLDMYDSACTWKVPRRAGQLKISRMSSWHRCLSLPNCSATISTSRGTTARSTSRIWTASFTNCFISAAAVTPIRMSFCEYTRR